MASPWAAGHGAVSCSCLPPLLKPEAWPLPAGESGGSSPCPAPGCSYPRCLRATHLQGSLYTKPQARGHLLPDVRAVGPRPHLPGTLGPDAHPSSLGKTLGPGPLREALPLVRTDVLSGSQSPALPCWKKGHSCLWCGAWRR